MMDRRSWLWRRKSFEKSPGETESSGSVSSHSERLSDDQEQSRTSPKHSQSPEVSSNLSISGESNEAIKTLTTKLQAALSNIKAKENLVKQHAKVAEEAVTGWEKAEKDALLVKQQLESAAQKNLALEDRVEHLDGALKECLRQLRQAREEQDQKVQDVVAEKLNDFESAKSSLESHISELQSQLESAKAALGSHDIDFQLKLETIEQENSALKQELQSLAKELEIRTLERDLSTQAAETASKQHLESLKKVTKLDKECRRLRTVTRKVPSFSNDHRSVSSPYVDSFTDSQSENGERLNLLDSEVQKMASCELNECETSCSDSWASALIAEFDQFKNEKASNRSMVTNTTEIDLLDNFLAMEKLVRLPETGNGSSVFDNKVVIEHSQTDNSNGLTLELNSLVSRVAQLEEELAREVHEKEVMRMALSEIQDHLDRSKFKLTEAEEKLVELQKVANLASDAKLAAEIKANTESGRRMMVERELEEADAEVHALQERILLLEFDIEAGKALSLNFKDKCQQLRAEVEKERALSLKFNIDCQHLQVEIEKERALSLKFKNDCQHLQAEIEKERALSAENYARWWILAVEIEQLRTSSTEIKDKCENLEMENKQEKVLRAEIRSRCLDLEVTVEQERESLTEIKKRCQILEKEIEQERAHTAEAEARCQALENAISRKNQETLKQRSSISKGELRVKQEKELAVATGKLADCQKTIASLGHQLKTLDDLLLDADIVRLNGDS